MYGMDYEGNPGRTAVRNLEHGVVVARSVLVPVPFRIAMLGLCYKEKLRRRHFEYQFRTMSGRMY